MNNINTEGGEIQDGIERVTEPLADSARVVCQSICQESKNALCCASEQIRKNPVPSVVGAFAFGIAVGCLIMSGRHTPTFQDRYVDEPLDQAGDVVSNISKSIGRLVANLKFW
ncbi:MAG: hypothetical protein ABI162_13725 [Luteolibacter sp.]